MTTANSSVDVVMPVRNRARYVAESLDSVRAQTLQPDKVVVVDDGSNDGTPAILAEYARSWPNLHVISTPPRGVSHARNVGISACEAPFVAFIDSDDIWLPQKLERQLELLNSRGPEVGFVHCGCSQIDEFGKPLVGGRVFMPSRRGDVFEAVLKMNYHVVGTASSTVVRSNLLAECGGFDEALTQAEDLDICLRMAVRSQVDFVPEVLLALRSHDDSSYLTALRNNPDSVLFQRLQIWNKWLDRIKEDEETLNLLRGRVVSAARARKSLFDLSRGFYTRLLQLRLPLMQVLFPSYWAFLAARHDRRWR